MYIIFAVLFAGVLFEGYSADAIDTLVTETETKDESGKRFGEFILFFFILTAFTYIIFILAQYSSEDTKNKKPSFNVPRIPKVKFSDSGWIVLYRVAGWICVASGIIVLLIGLSSNADKAGEEGFIFFCSSLLAALSCFFAAHILRLQEKAALYAERNAELMEKSLKLLGTIANGLNDKSK